MHPIKDPTLGCVEDNFDSSQNVACDAYIFDTQNIPYENSLVQELDLPPCTQSDWPLNVSLRGCVMFQDSRNLLKRVIFCLKSIHFTAFGIPNGLYQYGIHVWPFNRKFSIWNLIG